MPFDGTTQKPEVRVLDHMRELLATPDRWRKHGFWNDDHTQFCIVGALGHVDHIDCDLNRSVFEALSSVMPDHWRGRYIAEFNDDEQTTHADVLALIDRAIAKIA